jgi:hypothetical protein
MLVGVGTSARLAQADILPSGRLRIFVNENGGTGQTDGRELTIPKGYRFGVQLSRQMSFDAMPRLDDR